MTTTWQGIVVSVGGTPQPVIQALLKRKPGRVLFVVSESSDEDVEGRILPELAGYRPQYSKVVLSDPQDVGACYHAIRKAVGDWLAAWKLDPSQVYVDITGGMKTMSAALALAGVEYCDDITYVGGSNREAETGRVVSGSEEMVESKNPWRTYAVRDLERANELLRAYQADAASAVLRAAAERCDASRKRRLNAFAALTEALGRSDRFEFGKAYNILKDRRNDLELSLEYETFLKVDGLWRHWAAVRDEVNEDKKTPGRATLLELFANADRRAGQGRYDDAVGRLYRAVELRAQQLVKQAFGAELGKPSLDDFPSARREEVRAALREPGSADGRYELSLRQLFRALEFSDDAELRAQAGSYESVRRPLQDRNSSLLAHGVKPVAEPSFRSLRQAALAVCAVTEADIPGWPELTLTLPE